METLVFLIVAGIVYGSCCLSWRRPDYAIYGYLLLWLFFPKSITKLPWLGSLPWEGVDLYTVVKAIAGLTLLLVCLVHPAHRTWRHDNRLKSFFLGFSGMAVCTLLAVAYFVLTRPGLKEVLQQTEEGYRLLVFPTLDIFYAVLFGWACLRYIDTMDKVERMMSLFALSGVVQTVEVLLLYYLDLIPVLEPWVRDYSNSGRFGSLEFASFGIVGKMAIVNLGCVLYFILKRRRSRWLLVFLPVLALPVFATLQKAPLGGLLFALLVIFCLRMKHRMTVLIGAGALTVLTLAVNISGFGNLPGLVNERLGGIGRENVDVGDTFAVRRALSLRGVDIMIYYFPFGAGNGLVQTQMALGTPAYLENHVSVELDTWYEYFRHGRHSTNTHNLYVNFLVENGLPGLLILGIWQFMLLANFIRFLRFAPGWLRLPDKRPVQALASVYGILAGTAAHDLFEATENFYFISFFLLVLTYLLPALLRVQMRAAPSGARAARLSSPVDRGNPLPGPTPVLSPSL